MLAFGLTLKIGLDEILIGSLVSLFLDGKTIGKCLCFVLVVINGADLLMIFSGTSPQLVDAMKWVTGIFKKLKV